MRVKWIVGFVLVSAIVGAVTLIAFVTGAEKDGCVAGQSTFQRANAENPYFYTCGTAFYYPTRDNREPYKRWQVSHVDLSRLAILPFKYARDESYLYFVSVETVGWDDKEYSIRPIDEVDLNTLEILRETFIRDKTNEYTVLHNHYLAQRRSDGQ